MFNNYKYKFEVGPTLNFKINKIGNQLTFIEQMGTILNFNVKCYDETWVFYKVLLDFIENFAVGDVFINEG